MSLILAIETSCDDSGAAVVADGRRILSSVVSSQIEVHRVYGGVVPEIASRQHLESISLVVQDALDQAGIGLGQLQGVAVTYGPGLVGSLLVGVSYAKGLAFSLNLPLVAVNHLEGHIYAGFLQEDLPRFPLVALVVSGGHTSLIRMEDHGRYQLLGETRDDAAGEALDKVARALGLGYPGGPALERLASQGDPRAIAFPRSWLEEGSLDFSFSGLKSAVLNYLNSARQKGSEVDRAQVAASFQEAVVEVLVEKAVDAATRSQARELMVVGGVAANRRLRQRMEQRAGEKGLKVRFPPLELCGDNAAMIGCAAHYQMARGQLAGLSLNAVPDLSLTGEHDCCGGSGCG